MVSSGRWYQSRSGELLRRFDGALSQQKYFDPTKRARKDVSSGSESLGEGFVDSFLKRLTPVEFDDNEGANNETEDDDLQSIDRDAYEMDNPFASVRSKWCLADGTPISKSFYSKAMARMINIETGIKLSWEEC
ncbi:hypothetical protein HK098_005701 [Nowakowskiella sp. JEL0407]|nr:hypothetical protein HK098_005701 [Nowakowskiella sp. JEL0407]